MSNVETPERQLIVQGEEENLVTKLTSVKQSISSVKAETREEKVKIYNALNNPDYKLSNYINKTIKIKDMVLELVDLTNTETGECTTCPRIILIDDKGKTYSSVSIGIYNSLKRLVDLFGMPTWEEPVSVIVKQLEVKNGRTFTLEVE